MERYTHRTGNGLEYSVSKEDQEKAINELGRYENIGIEPGELAWMMADYKAMKDAEEQGRLIEFPVAIGQHLWLVNDYGIIEELVVHELVQSADGQTMLADSSGIRTYYSLSHVGETIFPTREQAEARLKELEAENG